MFFFFHPILKIPHQQVTQAGEILILTFGIQLAFASRNATTQFRVCLSCQTSGKSTKTFSHPFLCLVLFISSTTGKTVSCRINPHRICSFIKLLCNTRLVFVGLKPNDTIFSIIHSVSAHADHLDGN
jgi:hypothetical protein